MSVFTAHFKSLLMLAPVGMLTLVELQLLGKGGRHSENFFNSTCVSHRRHNPDLIFHNAPLISLFFRVQRYFSTSCKCRFKYMISVDWYWPEVLEDGCSILGFASMHHGF